MVWQELCIKEFGKERPSEDKPAQVTTEIGLARNSVSWKEFFISMWCSEIFVWGTGSKGRLGIENMDGMVTNPTPVPHLKSKGIHFLGKTAEIGSIAISKSGNQVYIWGQYAHTDIPVCINTEDLSPIPNDRAIHVSCGHDSCFLIIMTSGLVFWYGG